MHCFSGSGFAARSPFGRTVIAREAPTRSFEPCWVSEGRPRAASWKVIDSRLTPQSAMGHWAGTWADCYCPSSASVPLSFPRQLVSGRVRVKGRKGLTHPFFLFLPLSLVLSSLASGRRRDEEGGERKGRTSEGTQGKRPSSTTLWDVRGGNLILPHS